MEVSWIVTDEQKAKENSAARPRTIRICRIHAVSDFAFGSLKNLFLTGSVSTFDFAMMVFKN
ncbi:MAG: hypothetical protein LKM41_00970 [Lachnospiraceae bacterium]|jgi:hypothetical protein|nr:hypothetical protein [Lachnospiraceae bacterium]